MGNNTEWTNTGLDLAMADADLSVTFIPLPLNQVVAPTITLGTTTGSSIQILISGGENITSIVPRRDGVEFGQLPGSATNYTFTGLNPLTEYSLDLRVNGPGGPVYSNVVIDTTEAAAALLFFDDFERTSITGAPQNGINWTGFNNNAFGSGSISTDRAFSGLRSARLRFNGTTDLIDSSAELRMDPSGHVFDDEYCIMYRLWLPTNFYHRDVSGADNGKGIVQSWSGTYGAVASNQFIGFEFWPEVDGSSSLTMRAGQDGVDLAHDGGGGETGSGNMFRLSERGKWIQYRVHVKLASAPGADDGTIRAWKWVDGEPEPELLYDKTNWGYCERGNTIESFYLLGWSNSGYTETTDFYIDRFHLHDSLLAWESSAVDVIYADDFESATTGVTLTGRGIWTGAANVTTSTTRAFTGAKSARFRYIGQPFDQGNSTAELRFNLGALYKEVIIEYDFYVPSNYSHRNEFSSDNNKIFRLWGNVGHASDQDGYDSLEKVGATLLPQAPDGQEGPNSTLAAEWNTGNGIGTKGPQDTTFITAADHGQWMKVKIHCIHASPANNDGVIRIWKNGVLVINNPNVPNYHASEADHAFRKGYLMGWANSGFTNTTDFFIDNVVFSGVLADTQITFEQFELPTLPPAWELGSQAGGSVAISTNAALNYGNSAGSLRAVYPSPTPTGGVYNWGSYKVGDYTQETNSVYIRFYAKMPAIKHGLKFVKIFGYNPREDAPGGFNPSNPSRYANMTFGLDYTGVDNGGLPQIGFGDGSGDQNDAQQAINLDGTNPSWVGRSYGLPGFSLSTPNGRWSSSNWGTGWHLFEFFVKFNSGTSAINETNDGECFVRIDSTVYVDARGLFNRHWSNEPIYRVGILNQSQGSASGPFEIWYDNIFISTTKPA